MNTRLTTLERAFELARSGDFSNTSEIKEQLRREGFSEAGGQVSGPAMLKQLRGLCKAAQEREASPPRTELSSCSDD